MTVVSQKKRTSIAQVAAHAGVSRMAVHVALNPDKKTNVGVSSATRERIKAAIKELGYIPDNNARALVSGRTYNIGLLLHNLASSFDANLAEAFSLEFNSHGYNIVADSHHESEELERKKLMNFYSQNFDAVIISRVEENSNDDLLKRFIAGSSPVIILGGQVDLKYCQHVCFDEAKGLRTLVRHLETIGIRRISYLYLSQLEWAGKVRLHHLERVLTDYPALKLNDTVQFGNYPECRNTLRKWFAKSKAPEALVCYNDRLAFTVLHCLENLNVKVPEQTVVTGVDDDNDSLCPMPLSSMRLPYADMARACWKTFNSNKNIPVQDQSFDLELVTPQLMIRESSNLPHKNKEK